jgi:hypothetical protein
MYRQGKTHINLSASQFVFLGTHDIRSHVTISFVPDRTLDLKPSFSREWGYSVHFSGEVQEGKSGKKPTSACYRRQLEKVSQPSCCKFLLLLLSCRQWHTFQLFSREHLVLCVNQMANSTTGTRTDGSESSSLVNCFLQALFKWLKLINGILLITIWEEHDLCWQRHTHIIILRLWKRVEN